MNKQQKIESALQQLNLSNEPKCYCGNDLEFTSRTKAYYKTEFGGWRQYCSSKCMRNSPDTIAKRKATCLANHGVESYSQIQKFTKWDDETKTRVNTERKAKCLEKYGVEHHSQTKEYLDKRNATCVEKFGVINAFLQDKVKDTMIERYGVDTWLKTDAADISRRTRVKTEDEKNRAKITRLTGKNIDSNLIKILVEQNKEEFKIYLQNLQLNSRIDIARKIGFSPSHLNALLRMFNMNDMYLSTGTSVGELQLMEFLTELGIEFQIKNRSILKNYYELDIYIPSKNLAIEYNGIFWHSESMGKDSNYHLDKTEQCEAKGIQLLHIFENEWIDPVKREIWKSMIKNKLGLTTIKIGARECVFSELQVKTAREFLEYNHLNGFRGAERHLGLFYKNELMTVMSIGKSIQGETEIVRFASKINCNVVGAMTKLLSKVKVEKLITYADRRFSSVLNNSYSSQFETNTTTPPNWYGIESGILKHRLSYTKDKVKKLNVNYDDNKTVYENMLDVGIDRIWDCGNLKFSL